MICSTENLDLLIASSLSSTWTKRTPQPSTGPAFLGGRSAPARLKGDFNSEGSRIVRSLTQRDEHDVVLTLAEGDHGVPVELTRLRTAACSSQVRAVSHPRGLASVGVSPIVHPAYEAVVGPVLVLGRSADLGVLGRGDARVLAAIVRVEGVQRLPVGMTGRHKEVEWLEREPFRGANLDAGIASSTRESRKQEGYGQVPPAC